MTLLSTRGITLSVKLSARGHYGDHAGLLRDRCMGASCTGWLRKALCSCLPGAGKDHMLHAPLLVQRHLFPTTVRNCLWGCPGCHLTRPDSSAVSQAQSLSQAQELFSSINMASGQVRAKQHLAASILRRRIQNYKSDKIRPPGQNGFHL